MSILKYAKVAKTIERTSHIPRSKNNYIGIEIELLSPVSLEIMALILTENKLHYYVTVGTDSSIHSNVNGYRGLELRVLCKQVQFAKIVTKLTSLLKKMDCFVNASCGLHVHLDMRHRNSMACYDKLLEAQGLLYSVVAKHRRSSEYCMPLDNYEARAFKQFGLLSTRYGINPSAIAKHKTIELRMHEATLDAKQIVNYITLLINIINTDYVINGWSLCKNKVLPKKTLKYVEERIKVNGKARLQKEYFIGA
jgi:hypothetical protein